MSKRTSNVLAAVLTVLFLYFGLRKLLSHPIDVAIYVDLGFGQWPRFVTGSVEVLGAILLWVPRMRSIGALLLAGTMCVGLFGLLAFTTQPFLHLVALGAATGALAWMHRADVLRLTGRA
ncbi:MAG: DoxX family protein [Shimia sp.]